MSSVAAATPFPPAPHTAEKKWSSMSALNVILSIPANRKFLILPARLINSTSALAISLKQRLTKRSKKKGAFEHLFFALLYSCSHLLTCGLFLAGLVTTELFAASSTGDIHTQLSCPAKHLDRHGQVKYVIDGDTIVLASGEKIRLIGINAPETAHKNKSHTESSSAEPYGNAARSYLKTRLPAGSEISLQLGKDKSDRYGRTLAHIFLQNGENIQAELLARGLASSITIPPNDSLTNCYLEIEQQARCHLQGIWSQNHAILDSQQLSASDKGFHLIKGKVTRIDSNRHGIWVHLEGNVTLGIRPDNQALFDQDKLQQLKNKTVLVRGWLNKGKNNSTYIRIRHPSSLSVIGKNACNSLHQESAE